MVSGECTQYKEGKREGGDVQKVAKTDRVDIAYNQNKREQSWFLLTIKKKEKVNDESRIKQ